MLSLGIVTVSDRASTGVYVDQSGPAIRDVFSRWLGEPFTEAYRLVPDEQPLIEAALRELADEVRCHIIVTTASKVVATTMVQSYIIHFTVTRTSDSTTSAAVDVVAAI